MPTLDTIKEKLNQYFPSQPIIRAWIFGSYASGEQTPESDIDILVDYDQEKLPGLFGISLIMDELKNLLDTKVDLVENGRLYPRVAKEVEKNKILVYERIS